MAISPKPPGKVRVKFRTIEGDAFLVLGNKADIVGSFIEVETATGVTIAYSSAYIAKAEIDKT